ncbi:MAG: response regulator, partial [Gemmatimonadales bacterium]|nr:response regulator [Gemmatimonadales bacterium]
MSRWRAYPVGEGLMEPEQFFRRLIGSGMNDRVPVLVLDDDPIELRSLSEYLRLEDYKVTTAESLQEAFGLLESDHFRVVLADIRLPEGSGFDLLRHVQENDLPTAVIMVTGYGTIEDAVRAIKMGA